MLKLKLQYFGYLMRRTDSLEKTLMLGKIGGRRRRGWRGWDSWMTSPTQWTWVWVNSGSWWWTGRPGVLQSMGSQRIRHDWVTELNWTELKGLIAGKDWRQEEKGTTGWDGWMPSPTQWTWVWASSGSWWWRGKPDMLQLTGSQRVRHDWAIELTEMVMNYWFTLKNDTGNMPFSSSVKGTYKHTCSW